MKPFAEELLEEAERQERLNPAGFVKSRLISAKIALKAGIEPEVVARVLKLRLSQIKKLLDN